MMVRRLSQALFLLISLAVFLGLLRNRVLADLYHGLHVFPALSSAGWRMLPAVLVLALAAVFGRSYCAFLCPAGFIQDLASKFWRRWSAAKPAAARLGPRLFILIAALTLLALGSSAYLYLDHFSSLGRVYGLLQVLQGNAPFGPAAWLGLAFLAVLTLAPRSAPRWFCNTLCPSGALFMLLSRIAPFKIRVAESCADCGACSDRCPTLSIRGGSADPGSCIQCLECIPACPQGAVSFSPSKPSPGPGGMSRRRFLALAAAAVAAPLALKRLLRAGVAGPSVILPPGAKPLERFMAKCSACGTCASVCPTKALSPTLGPGRMRMDYDRGYCDYGCSACMSACPTGALARLPLDEKKRLKLGSARLDESLCVPHSTGKPCGACASACPTGALASVRRKPVLDDARCIGCGLCQYVCMAWPEKAIRVEAVT